MSYLATINGKERLVVMTREVPAVQITACDIGDKLGCGQADEQAEILHQWAEAVEGYSIAHGQSWPMQCRMIVDEIESPRIRARIASMLDCLIDHLREATPAPPAAEERER